MAGRNGLVIFIVDDQPTALETLASDLQQYNMVESIHCFSNYADATLPLIEMQPDVLFLDVEVPGRTGIDFIDSIKPHVNFTFKVVFYTAYSDYMLDAIRHAAYDYLLKPYKPEELSTVMERLHSESLEGNSIRTLPEEDASRKLAIQAVSELLLLRTEQILLFMYQPDSRSWRITLTDGTEHLLKKGLHADELLTHTHQQQLHHQHHLPRSRRKQHPALPPLPALRPHRAQRVAPLLQPAEGPLRGDLTEAAPSTPTRRRPDTHKPEDRPKPPPRSRAHCHFAQNMLQIMT